MTLDIIGWLGTGLILLAYLLVSIGKVSGRSSTYQLLNLFGALTLGVYLWFAASWPAFALQVAWGVIAIAALARLFMPK